jgi:hypothetical protein
VSALVRRGDATLGLRYGIDSHPDLLSTTLHDEPLVPVCAPHHRLARARRVRPAALAGERWITFPPPAGGGVEPSAAAVERSLAASGMPPGERVLIDSLTAQKRMVEAGFGLALLQASSVDEELRAGTLAVLPIPALRATVPIVLIQRRRAFSRAPRGPSWRCSARGRALAHAARGPRAGSRGAEPLQAVEDRAGAHAGRRRSRRPPGSSRGPRSACARRRARSRSACGGAPAFPPPAGRYRRFERRAWKASQFEQDEISR